MLVIAGKYIKLFDATREYQLGVALKKDELLFEDKLFGLTQKYFKSDYLTIKNGIMQDLLAMVSYL